MTAVQSALQGVVGTQGGALNGAVAQVNGAADAQGGVMAITQLNVASSTLAAAAAVSGYVGRAAANLAGTLL